MIHRLRLRNWRSFDQLDIEFSPGTTFVVAPNGVGKTSLVLGLAWGVYGNDSGIDPKSCIRAGADRASVEVYLTVEDQQIAITREVKRRGSPTAIYRLGDADIDEATARRTMEESYGVTIPVAARLSTMLGGGHLAAQAELDLQGHLHHAFGVSHILEAANIATDVAKDAEKRRAAIRTSTQTRLEDRTKLADEVNTLQAQHKRLEDRLQELEDSRRTADLQRQLVHDQIRLAQEWERVEQARADLVLAAQQTIGSRSINADNLDASLDAEHDRATNTVSAAATALADQRGVVAAAELALELLDNDDPVCPTCRRPIGSNERATALTEHRTQREAGLAEIEKLESVADHALSHSQEIARLQARLAAIEKPKGVIAPHENVLSAEEADDAYTAAVATLDSHNQLIGETRTRLNQALDAIAADETLAEVEAELRLAYRREAIAAAAAKTLRKAADDLIETRIRPIAEEIQWRWKRLFASDGLTLRADGSIVRTQAGQQLGWDTLSGGERIWARIVTHLLVLGTTTTLPFAWFDEPLEHLDPQLRHTVAATLAKTTESAQAPNQLLITTYEHAIAQQLAEDTQDANLIAIRRGSGDIEPSPAESDDETDRRAS